MKVCLNFARMKTLIGHYSDPGSTCKVSRIRDPNGSAVVEATCEDSKNMSSRTRSEWSPDGHTFHARTDLTDNDPSGLFPKQSWQEVTMEYQGDCPAPMRSDQGMLFIDADGKARDPLEDAERIVKGTATPATPNSTANPH